MEIKKQYEQPELVVYGSVEELTQAKNGMIVTDGAYPAGTPLGGHTS